MTTPTLQIAYRELASELQTVVIPQSTYEFSQRKVHNTDIGIFQERTIMVGEVRIHEINTQFTRNCKVAVNDEFLSQSLHVCLPLEGSVAGNFEDAEIAALLKPRTHHYLFTPGQDYDLMFDKGVKLAHVEFPLSYLKSLLCPSERWSNELQEKFQKQEVVYSGGIASRTTNEIVQSILHCSLTGNLRRLFLEAKVLELVATQLEHYRAFEESNPTQSLKKSDRQLMEDVRAFLITKFTDDHSLQSIATQFGINEFKLKKNFKLQFGYTIFDFLFDLKMDHAYRLLIDGGKFVNEVSREIGYKNPNHFTTAFTKKFGVSPSKLRN
jgi:AraC-like DNA-binding protein